MPKVSSCVALTFSLTHCIQNISMRLLQLFTKHNCACVIYRNVHGLKIEIATADGSEPT